MFLSYILQNLVDFDKIWQPYSKQICHKILIVHSLKQCLYSTLWNLDAVFCKDFNSINTVF